ncbi:MAG: hypothetical protein AB7P14_11015 [Blastocatellales bacterium]
MKKRFSNKPFVCISLLTSLTFTSFSAIAQNLPPIKPAIEREPGESKLVKVSNFKQSAPILATAKVHLGRQTYGDGLLRLKNVADKPVLAFKGIWKIYISDGSTLTNGWSYGGATSLVRGGMNPGDDVTLPVSGPSSLTVNGRHRITGISISITGVVFNDFTRWGEEAGEVYHKLDRDVEEMKYVVERLLAECQKSSLQDFGDKLALDSGNSLLPDMKYRMLFQNYLLDEAKTLRFDAVQKLETLLSTLKEANLH